LRTRDVVTDLDSWPLEVIVENPHHSCYAVSRIDIGCSQPSIWIHKGFLSAFFAIVDRSPFIEILIASFEDRKSEGNFSDVVKVSFVGHSLGGAMAQLTAMIFKNLDLFICYVRSSYFQEHFFTREDESKPASFRIAKKLEILMKSFKDAGCARGACVAGYAVASPPVVGGKIEHVDQSSIFNLIREMGFVTTFDLNAFTTGLMPRLFSKELKQDREPPAVLPLMHLGQIYYFPAVQPGGDSADTHICIATNDIESKRRIVSPERLIASLKRIQPGQGIFAVLKNHLSQSYRAELEHHFFAVKN
jgi:hypothetical protein